MQRRTFLLAALAGPAWAQLPEALDSRRGIHPRLFLDAARAASLREAIETTHTAQWKIVKRYADQYAAQAPPKDHDDGDAEQLWQREVGNKQPFLAMAWLLTGNSAYLKAAQDWCLASCSYATWGSKTMDGSDLAAGHQLLGLALCYDWLYHDLSPDARQTIRATLLRRGAQMYRAATATMYWRNSYLQNHLWVNVAGLAAAGFALWDEPDVADTVAAWIQLPLDKFRATEAALGPDGASHEGVPYWSYGVEYMLKFWALASDLLQQDLTSAWWANTAAYRLYMGLPRNAWTRTNLLVDIGDSPTYDWYGPEFLLRRLAARYQDGYAQWLARELENAGMTAYSAAWLNLVWYDPAVEPQAPTSLPTLRHFSDMELVSARSDWSGSESMVVFKCGPPIGHEATAKFDYDPGSGHVHPDAGHFVLFGAGEWLVRDEGYAWKETDHHNTLLIGGKGQLGEGYQWFRGIDAIRAKSDPRVLLAQSSAEVDRITGDVAQAYPAALGLKWFVRKLVFLRPDVLIVVDEVETAEPKPLELRFHPAAHGVIGEDGAFIGRGKTSVLRIDPLTPEGLDIAAGETAAKNRDGNVISLYAVRMGATRAQWRNAVALSWSAADAEPVKVTLDRTGPAWTFRAGERSVVVE